MIQPFSLPRYSDVFLYSALFSFLCFLTFWAYHGSSNFCYSKTPLVYSYTWLFGWNRIFNWKLFSLRFLKLLLYSILAFRVVIKVYFHFYSQVFVLEISFYSGSFKNPLFLAFWKFTVVQLWHGWFIIHCVEHSVNS